MDRNEFVEYCKNNLRLDRIDGKIVLQVLVENAYTYEWQTISDVEDNG